MVVSAMAAFRLRLAAVACLALALYLAGNGATSLWDRDEPRFAEAAREMVVRGDYVVPRFHRQVRYDKPPLVYWLMAACYRATGPTAFGARLPSALAGALAVALTGLAGRYLVGEAAALWGALALALALQLGVEAKVATADATLLATIAAGQLALVRSWRGAGGWANGLLGWGAVALGILAKGPVAPAVVGGTALGLKLAGGRRWPWPWPRLAAGLALLLALTLPWAVAVQRATGGEFLRVALGHHVVERAARALEGHRGPWWYYLAALPVSFFPWSFLGYGAAARLLRHGREPEARLLLLWLALPFLLFSLAATKLPHYVLPAYPALALALGAAVAQAARPRWWGAASVASGLLGLALGIGLAVGAGRALPAGFPAPVGVEALLLCATGCA
ncbi:MAG: phospholipid carrier-dependent glycosyltransferase, partial [Nitrospirae bacterium]